LLDEYSRLAKEFLKNPMGYNTNLAMGSTHTESEPLPEGHHHTGVPVCKINDMTSFHLSDLRPPPGRTCLFGQIYTLPPEEAIEARKANEYAQNLNMELLELLDKDLRDVNPYVRMYKMANDILKEEEEKAAREGKPLPKFQLHILNRQEAFDAGVAQPNNIIPITLMDAPTVSVVRKPKPISARLSPLLFR
jgi:hypothetical protein